MYSYETEYGRVSALRIDLFDEYTSQMQATYRPQVEIIKYDPSSGDIVNSSFVVVGDLAFSSEIKALESALESRYRMNNPIKKKTEKQVPINDPAFKQVDLKKLRLKKSECPEWICPNNTDFEKEALDLIEKIHGLLKKYK